MKETDSLQEAALLQQVQTGNELAFGCLMRKYFRELYHYGNKFSQDDALIKDCIQEVFISLWQRRENITSILSIKYYLLRAIKNKILKALYASNQQPLLLDGESGYPFLLEFSAEHLMIERQMTEEKARKLSLALAQLTKKQKEIIYLKYYQYLDFNQIAELMHISRQSVYNLMHETISRLRKILRSDLITQ